MTKDLSLGRGESPVLSRGGFERNITDSSRHCRVRRIGLSLGAMFALTTGSAIADPSDAGPECQQDGTRGVCVAPIVDDGGPGVRFSVTGMVPSTTYRVRVVQRDGTAVSGDGSGAAWPKPYDTVQTDAEGDFNFVYRGRGGSGLMDVEILPASGTEVAVNAAVDPTFVGVGTVGGVAVANPPRPTGCGLDIVLVMDSSGSVNSTQLNQMRTALTSFVNAFLPGTPSQMAVVDFDTQAYVVQGFTTNIALLTSAINTPTSGGFTNWDDALYDARNLFPNRVDKADLIVFASDGNPNYRYGHLGQIAASTSAANALSAAVVEADLAKTAGIRIETIGIGSGISSANMIAISSADAYTATDFAGLATTLANMAIQLCGGSITVTKYLDADGSLGTTGDQTVAMGWTFSTNVDAPDSSTPASGATDSGGQVNFHINTGADLTGVVDIVETLQSGHTFLSASCLKGGNPVGTPGSANVDNISIGTQDIVTCKFINHKLPVCGNGTVESGEQCDDGNSANGDCCSSTCQFEANGSSCAPDSNQCTNDVCNGAGVCTHPNSSSSVTCELDGNLCTNDHCNGFGACVFLSNVTCAAAVPPCEGGATCNPGTGLCVNNADAPSGTACNLDGNLCTTDQCNGSGSCVFVSNVTCSPAVPPCEGGSTCSPGTGLCVNNPDAPNGTSCEADGNLCTIDECNGTGSCVQDSVVTCSPPTGPCDAGQTCNTGTGFCDNLTDPTAGTACDLDANQCTHDQCNGTGSCVYIESVVCPNSTGPCDAGQQCVPGTGLCADLTDPPMGTFCELDGNLCTNNECNGLGACVLVGVVVCPGPTELCDGGTSCTPATGACDPLPDLAAGTPCDRDSNLCSIDYCDGAGHCAFDSNVVCQSPAPPCEAGAACEPSTGHCVDNPDASAGTSCNLDGNFCTIDECNGTGQCVFDSNVVCQAPNPPCEAGEVCLPATGLCDPLPDALMGTTCELDSTLCTIDQCNGAGQCVFLTNVVCAGPIPPCEAGQTCNATTGMCDNLLDAIVGTACEFDGNLCTLDQCNGTGSCVNYGNVSCQPAAPPCEAGEFCNTATGFCVALSDATAATGCEFDGDLCTIDMCDGNGSCATVSSVTCAPPSGECEAGEYCDTGTGACLSYPDPVFGTTCQSDATLCTQDHCDGLGSCVTFNTVVCPGSTGVCDEGENCDPLSGLCVSIPDPPLSTDCEEDGNLCTIEHCDGNGSCVVFDQVVCPGPMGPCDAGTVCNPATGACDVLPDPSAGTPCDRDGDLCTVDECDGTGSCLYVTTTTCAGPDGPCDGGEFCNSATGLCNSFPETPVGTTCEADGSLCTIDQCDGLGACVNVNNVTCTAPVPPCEGGSTCNPMTGACDSAPDADATTTCERDGNLCTLDHCDGLGQCVFGSDVVCVAGVPPCDGGETCEPMSGLCVMLPDAPTGTPCDPDSNVCTSDICDGSGLCTHPDLGLYCGACCNALDGTCTENQLPVDCEGTQLLFTLGAGCDEIACNARLGACCDFDVFGGCQETTYAQCNCPTCVWTKLRGCEQVDCIHNSIPAVSEWGLVVLTLLLLTGAKISFGRRPGSAVA